MNTLLLIIIVVLLFGGGGGYYGHRRWGKKGSLGMSVGAILMILLLLYMMGILR